jgi:heptosyltransferase-2
MANPKNKIEKILVVRNDRFGEFLLNIPAFRALKESFPGSRLTLVVNHYVEGLAECIDSIDNLLIWENRKHKLNEIIKFSKVLKNEKFDLCVILNPSKEFNIISFLAGIPLRVGYNRKWGFLLNRKTEDRKCLGEKHEIEYNLELVNLVGAKTENKALSLRVSDDIINGLLGEYGLKSSDNLIAIHPWTSDPIKQWPLVHFLELIKKMVKEFNLKILIIGGEEQILTSQQLFKDLGKNVIDLTGRTTLKELAVLLERCKLLISGDSGPNHLAGAVGVPVIAIFRSDLPTKSSTRWGPVSPGSVVIEKSNLSDISVDEVFDKAKEVLNK